MLFLIVKKLRKYVTSSVMLYAILLTGPASMLAIEFGWFLTEMGRQPWIIRGYMRVSEAATQAGNHISNDVIRFTISFITSYFGLCTN